MTDSYTREVERQNSQLQYHIQQLENDIVTLQNLIAFRSETIQKIEVRPGEDTVSFRTHNHWFRVDELTQIEPNYISREPTFSVTMKLTLNKEQLDELQQKLNNHLWTGI